MPQHHIDATKECSLRLDFGRKNLSLREAKELDAGAVIELDAFADDYVDVYADGQPIARGRPIIVEGKLAVRVQEAMRATVTSGQIRGIRVK